MRLLVLAAAFMILLPAFGSRPGSATRQCGVLWLAGATRAPSAPWRSSWLDDVRSLNSATV